MAAHRVLKRLFRSGRIVFTTRGDACANIEEEVFSEDILGRVRVVERSSSLISKLKPLAAALLCCVQRPKIYRFLAKRVIAQDFFYHLEAPEDNSRFIVARKGNEVIGRTSISNFSPGEFPFSGWRIYDLWVNWRYRRLGIGERLTKMSCDIAAQGQAREIKLLAFRDSKPAIRLYRKMGFRRISIPEIDKQLREEAERTRRERIIMAKDIQMG